LCLLCFGAAGPPEDARATAGAALYFPKKYDLEEDKSVVQSEPDFAPL
jgi:hypothetical protein